MIGLSFSIKKKTNPPTPSLTRGFITKSLSYFFCKSHPQPESSVDEGMCFKTATFLVNVRAIISATQTKEPATSRFLQKYLKMNSKTIFPWEGLQRTIKPQARSYRSTSQCLLSEDIRIVLKDDYSDCPSFLQQPEVFEKQYL